MSTSCIVAVRTHTTNNPLPLKTFTYYAKVGLLVTTIFQYTVMRDINGRQ